MTIQQEPLRPGTRLHDNGHTRIVEFFPGTGPTALAWVEDRRDEIRDVLDSTGAVLLRGIPAEVGAFRAVCDLIAGELLPYTERSTPRRQVAGNVYTSTEYPADLAIPMHNENSYQLSWPSLLFFACHVAPAGGGATPLADSAAVLGLIPEETRARFAGGVTYYRNLRADLGLSWPETFQLNSREEVESYCEQHDIGYQWDEDDLRIHQVRPATHRDPVSGTEVWFNQAHLFHVSSLPAELRAELLDLYAPEELPRHAALGDGSPIPDEDLAGIAHAYDVAALAVPWSVGDVMVINNIRIAHGREPFTGSRRILVAMA